ncbi:ABC transporter ATP-binding protein [Nocardia panacis]|uniref:ABC transporter ATP-binding protein n=1 Tax=Nocardia panacis TaxID=2340916 RepID=A0A3A4K1Q8_9NOCA|nr:ABC transporter ATP-binding protein [Nocardia panacis]RJO73690.1 ABC transporter ATP-binding protein [Nocardia panacis]
MSSRAKEDRMPRQLWQMLAGHRGALALGLLLMLVAAGLGIAQPLAMKAVIDGLTASRSVVLLVIGLVVLMALEVVVNAAASYVLERTGERFLLRLRTRLFSRLLRLTMPTFDRFRLGDLMSRASTDVIQVREAATRAAVELAASVVMIAATLVVMFLIDPVLMCVVVGVLIAATAAISGLTAAIGRVSTKLQDTVGAMSADLERVMGAIRTVRASRAEQRETQRLTELAHDAYTAGVRSAFLMAAVSSLINVAVNGAFVVVLLVGAVRVGQDALALSSLVALLLYANQLVLPVAQFVEGIATVYKVRGAAQRATEVFTLPVEESAPATVIDEPPRSAPVLEIRNLRFGYTPDAPVLQDLSLTVPHNSLVALIGPSGAGKSTALGLINRFYQPWQGSIHLDGYAATELDLAAWRARIGWVEQDCQILHGTLRDNLRYIAHDADDRALWHAIDLVNLREKVEKLPDGLDSQVGEHGARLSSGERQRVAIARAVLARPRLLLLDEPTAHLDPANEAALTTTLDNLRGECALLVIAHRMSTIRSASSILLLANGTARATGTWTELFESPAEFGRLVNMREPEFSTAPSLREI